MSLKIGTVCLVSGVHNHPLTGEIVTTTTVLTETHWYGSGRIHCSPVYEIKGRTPPLNAWNPESTWVAEHSELIPLAPPGDPDEVDRDAELPFGLGERSPAEKLIRKDILKKIAEKIGGR